MVVLRTAVVAAVLSLVAVAHGNVPSSRLGHSKSQEDSGMNMDHRILTNMVATKTSMKAVATVAATQCGMGHAPCIGSAFCTFDSNKDGVCRTCADIINCHGLTQKGELACEHRCQEKVNNVGPGMHHLNDAASASGEAQKCGAQHHAHCSEGSFCSFNLPDGSGECRGCGSLTSCSQVHGNGVVKAEMACNHMCPYGSAHAGGGEGAALGGGYQAEPAYVEPAYVAPAAYVAPEPAYVAPAPAYAEPAYAEPAYVAPAAYAEPAAYAAPAAYVEPAYVTQVHTTTEVEGCIDNYQWLRGLIGLMVICSAVNFIKGPNCYDAALIVFWMFFIEHLMCHKETFGQAAYDYEKGYEATAEAGYDGQGEGYNGE